METKQKLPQHSVNEKDSALLRDLYNQVAEEVRSLPVSRMKIIRMKVFVLPAIYLGIYVSMLLLAKQVWLFYLLYCLLGVMTVVIFSNLIHELCHGNIFKSSRHNALAYHIFDMLGANSYIWKQRHLKLHHRYPNTNGWDADVEQRGPVAVFPNEEKKKIHRYQHVYVFFLYPLFLLNWLLVRDFRDYFSGNRVIRKVFDIPVIEYFKLGFFKIFYVSMILVLPYLLTEFSLAQVFIGFLILGCSGSIVAMLILLTPHINSDNAFLNVNMQGKIEESWFRHQLATTNDISNTNWFTRNVMGNFNYHLVHHLFPKISSVYAPEVTRLVKVYLEKNNLPYRSYSLGVSFKKHYQLIRSIALSTERMQ